MVKYRFPGIGGSSLLLLGSSIRLDARLQFLARPEGDDATCADGDLFAGFGVSAGPPILVPEVEIAETGQLHLLPGRESRADFLEEQIDQLTCFALVETQLIEQGLRHLCLRQGCHAY